MPILVLVVVLCVGWLGSQILALEAISLLRLLLPPSWVGLIAVLSIVIWCFGE
ncbi:hypothetical protein [Roseofilum casamattae]|uniref:Uncharacterized protein n=1 Tax=Roseofilum casamattae BLCC-M143 TaxID=3022442 RepID=A0ABT7C0F6_9CYAN|nr:hypothetical protein [Roseofilum casamattae]MDJ1184931.1 hypothetical protein [Roseofilum casamattae BLCC-M143]